MNHTADFINALTSPDRRYGEVPFYWWNGGALDKDRLTKQLKELSKKGLAGVQVNYCHINKGGENDLPYGGHGKSLEGLPEQFSDEWWEFFSYAARECEKLGMSIGMGDYTIAWIGNGYFTDTIANMPDMNATNLTCEQKMLFSGDEENFTEDTLAVITYSDSECKKPVIIYEKGKGILSKIPGIANAFIVKFKKTENSIDPLNSECGKLLVELYFKEFERRVPDLKPGTLNYFFQDELMFGANTKTLWSESLRNAVQKKYGYDLLGFIPHLFFNLGNFTPVIRLNTADVKTELIEENYFKPIYEYHASRGLIYGCDQSSRGKEPDEFSDYFRTVRWFTAPGNDTPGRAADLIKVKVNSSIAHLYKRPRVWLEGYHSSGWGTTLESITAPTSDNFIYGANLLNLHGLYYSTDGGFFEWAPPDFHFRMPYWDDEKYWLDKYKRLSQLLTTGVHRCDAAIFYPVSSCDYGENHEKCIETTFSLADYLFNHGVDFDFIDFQSIENAECKNGKLCISDEKYKVLIFAGVDCIRQSSVDKAKSLLADGGKVVFCGITPYISDKYGLGSKEFLKEIEEMLNNPNCYLAAGESGVLSFINSKIVRSFTTDIASGHEKAYVHTRVHGNDKLFFVRYAEKDSICRFEATGNTYLLDTDKGEYILLSGCVEKDGFTYIKMPLDKNSDTLILFTENELPYEKEINIRENSNYKTIDTIPLDGYWDFYVIPTLDNTYGDYYIPSGGIIGPEARFFDIARVENKDSIPESFSHSFMPYCTSDAIRKINCSGNKKIIIDYLSENEDLFSYDSFILDGEEYKISKERFHDRYGYHSYEYSPSLYEQGHHGLKGRVYDDNVHFTEDCIFFTYVYSPEDCEAILEFGDIKPELTVLNKQEVTEGEISLRKGKNLIFVSFSYDEKEIPNYRNSSSLKRTSFYIKKKDAKKSDVPFSVSSFANDGYFRFSEDRNENNIFCFAFDSVPSLEGLEISTYGEILAITSNGIALDFKKTGTGNFGTNKYTASTKNISPDVSKVLFYVKSTDGKEYASLLPESVKLFSGKGRMKTGDLAKTGALVSFSGKAVYEKDIKLQKLYPEEHFYLEIEDANATVNVEINGKTAAVFTYRPFTDDITDFVQNGKNHIKITVSNTLCNHYSTIPSKYSNFPEDSASGLTGRVNIVIKEKQ